MQLAQKERKDPDHCGYLFKYRPYSTSLFSPPWELRYFTLSGNVLYYFATEKDAAAHPRGRLAVAVVARTHFAHPYVYAGVGGRFSRGCFACLHAQA